MNILEIIRKDGLPVALHLDVNFQGQLINKTIAFYDATIGDFTNGATTITHRGETYPITLDTNVNDNGVNGATAHAELVDLTTHTLHPHGEISNAKSLAETINGALLSIANIFGRLESLEKALALLVALDKRVFVKWIVRGTEFQCEMPNVDDGLASFDLKDGFDGFSEDLNPDDPNDSRQMLYLKTREFGTFRIITARQELGKIRDAVNANSDVAVHSEPLPAEETGDDET